MTDEDILEEVGGGDGISGQRLKRDFSIVNRSHLASVRTDMRVCLRDNPLWHAHLLRHIDEIEKEFPTAEAHIEILNPCAGVMTLFLATATRNGVSYLPNYILIVAESELRRVYFGQLIAEGVPCRFGQMLDKYYDGQLRQLLLTLTWGGYERRDTACWRTSGSYMAPFDMTWKEMNGATSACTTSAGGPVMRCARSRHSLSLR